MINYIPFVVRSIEENWKKWDPWGMNEVWTIN